jgi:UDP-glucose 4-epimerase
LTVLVTGATGFVGTALLGCVPAGTRVMALARRVPADEPRPDVVWVEGDLTAPASSWRLPHAPDAIVHLAQGRAGGADPAAATAELFAANVAPLVELLAAARGWGTKHIVLASTGSVYRSSAEPAAEDAPVAWATPYAASKLAAEACARAYAPAVPATILRLFTIYGPGQSGRLVPGLIDRVRNGRAVTLEGADGLLLSPVHVRDVAAVIWAAVAAGAPDGAAEIVNVAAPEVLSIRAMADAMGAALGTSPRFEQQGAAAPGGYVADLRRFEERFGARRFVRFADGIAETVGAASPGGGS